MIEKAYVRFREDLPDNQNTFAAAEGFTMMGVKIVPFYGFGDINATNMPDLGEKAILCGNIGDVWDACKVMNITVPEPIDYPKHLEWMIQRGIRKATLDEVRGSTTVQFVKPVQQKLFTGFVFDPLDPICRLNVACYHGDTECYVSDAVNFVSEWRCFVRHGVVTGVRHYKGDWSKAPDKTSLDLAVSQGRMSNLPKAHVLDLGVIVDPSGTEHTELVEANEGYAVGSYGLASIVYARFLETRWEELIAVR